MPGTQPENGDVYGVYRNVTTNPSAVGDLVRPMACVASQKLDLHAWTAMARSTTDGRPHEGDLFSPAQVAIGLDQDGHWSLRWIHSVLKAKTGGEACEFKGSLADPERGDLLSLYRNRHKQA